MNPVSAGSLGEALRELTAAFTAAGLDSPQTDARLLVAYALNLDKLLLVTEPQRLLSDRDRQVLTAIASRRLTREPVSRIMGERWFYGRPFKLSPATLDPRPDSETLVDVVMDFVRKEGLVDQPLRLLDVGTGSGCLLLTLLAELPAATGVGVDISGDALEMAAANATALGVSPARVTWLQGAGFESVSGLFNVILSNPPYIPRLEIADLDAEVRVYDPMAALDGGVDGLDFYRSWSVSALKNLDKPLAMIVFEVGSGQAGDVATLLRIAAGPSPHTLEMHKDLAGVERCVALITRSVTSR